MQKYVGKIWSAVVVLTAIFAILTSATAQEQKPTAPANIPDAQASDQRVTAALLQKASQDETGRYRVGVGDELSIEVFRHPEYSTPQIKISENGLIVLPRIEQPVQAVCKTENELTAEITELYKKILNQPFIRVRVLSYQSQPVAVIGAVEKAGQLYLNRKMRLMQVVALAGGPNKEAGTRIQVARLGTNNICEQVASSNAAPQPEEQDLSKLLYSFSLKKTLEGDAAANPWMEPGDLVYVSEADKAFVVGNVKDPKPILLKSPLTLTQAIAAAGGVLAATKKKQVILVRSDDAGNKTKIPVDLIAVAQGKQEDPFLKANDIIEVPTDSAKVTRNSIVKAFTNGLPSVLPFILP